MRTQPRTKAREHLHSGRRKEGSFCCLMIRRSRTCRNHPRIPLFRQYRLVQTVALSPAYSCACRCRKDTLRLIQKKNNLPFVERPTHMVESKLQPVSSMLCGRQLWVCRGSVGFNFLFLIVEPLTFSCELIVVAVVTTSLENRLRRYVQTIKR